MPILNSEVSDQGKDPMAKLNKVLAKINTLDAEAQFVDKAGKTVITRDYMEMVISEYSQSAQNPQVYNKWLALDTKIEKSLREYKSGIALLIGSIAQMGQFQGTPTEEIPTPTEDLPQAPAPVDEGKPEVGRPQHNLPERQ